jgi:hypothetical protein
MTEADRKMPPFGDRAWNLAGALAAFAADGCRTVPKTTYRIRLQVCAACSQRDDNWCLECGCFLPIKAKGRAWQCPLDKWPTA